MSAVQYLEWKLEPVSPYAEEIPDDVALYDGISASSSPTQHYDDDGVFCVESKAELASKLLQDLEQLEDLDEYIKTDFEDLIKDEPFSNWLEEKMLPMFEEVATGVAVPVQLPMLPKVEQHIIGGNENVISVISSSVTSLPDTQSLLQEFEHVLDTVEFNHLTPPHSPPHASACNKQPYQLATLAPVNISVVPQLDAAAVLIQHQTLLQEQVAREMAVVDEIVRTRAENLAMENVTQFPPSPGSNSCSGDSGSSNFGDCSSSSEDPEWIPETVDLRPFDSLSSRGHSLSSPKSPGSGGSRKRSKPYSRGVNEEKKSRKKEQNKNAATRYRMKKKAEVEEILEEERAVADENLKLENRIGDIRREIRYLKGLMRDLFKAKGLVN